MTPRATSMSKDGSHRVAKSYGKASLDSTCGLDRKFSRGHAHKSPHSALILNLLFFFRCQLHTIVQAAISEQYASHTHLYDKDKLIRTFRSLILIVSQPTLIYPEIIQ